MYTPINWASPNNLEIIKEKRDIARLNDSHANEVMHKKKEIKTKCFDTLNRVFAFRQNPIFNT